MSIDQAVFDSSAILSISSGYANLLNLSNVTCNTNDSVLMNFANATNQLTITNCSFNSPCSFKGPQIVVNGSNFNNPLYIERKNASLNSFNGGNTYNSSLTIIDSSAASYVMRFGNGTPDACNGEVTVIRNGSGQVLMAHSGNNSFKGNITVGGTNAVQFSTGGGKSVFNGNGIQTINNLNATAPIFTKVEINKSSGLIKLNTPITLGTDTLKFVKGVIVADTINFITMQNGSKTVGGSDSSYVHGSLKKIGNAAFTFPLGDTSLHTGAYHPLGISAPSSSSAEFKAQYFSQGQSLGSSKDSTIERVSDCEYWNLDRLASTSTVSITLNWNSNSCNIVSPSSNMRVTRWNGSKWIDVGNGGSSSSPPVGSVTTSAAQSSFGKFTLADVICSSLQANAGPDISLNDTTQGLVIGASPVANYGTPPFSYLWTPSESLDDSTLSNPTALPSSSTIYTVRVTDANGCTASDMMTFSVPEIIISAPDIRMCGNDTIKIIIF